jgi:hypothetical protein
VKAVSLLGQIFKSFSKKVSPFCSAITLRSPGQEKGSALDLFVPWVWLRA